MSWIYAVPEWGEHFDEDLYKICSQLFTGAKKIVKPNGQNGKPGEDYHCTLIYHGHPFTAQDMKFFDEIGVEDKTYTAKMLRFIPGSSGHLVLLLLEQNEMCELFDEIYNHLEENSVMPEHTRYPGYYKGYSPHLTVAEYESPEALQADFKRLGEEGLHGWLREGCDKVRITDFKVVNKPLKPEEKKEALTEDELEVEKAADAYALDS